MDKYSLSDKDKLNLKNSIYKISIETLLSKEPINNAFIKIIEELRKAIALLKIDWPVN